METIKEREPFRRLEHLLATGSTVFYVCEPDHGLRATYVSPNIRTIFGYAPDEIAGQPGRWTQLIHPLDRERVVSEVKAAIERDSHSMEYRFRCADGSYVWVSDELHMRRNGEGRLLEIVGTCIDVTSQHNALEKIHEQSQLLDFLYDGLIVTDVEGRITDWNRGAERLFGYKKEEVLARKPALIHSPSYDGRLTEEIVRTVASEGKWSGEIQFVRKDGVAGVSETIVAEHRSESGELIGTIGINRDITERRRGEELRRALENQIQTAQKLESLGVLAGGIAHDFNNLLVGILGSADLAKFSLPKESPAHADIEAVVRAAQRASELCQQLLAYSGKGKFLIETTNLNALVRESDDLLKLASASQAELRYDLSREAPTVRVDKIQVRQVLMNLVGNAADAIGPVGGTITISTGAVECDPSTWTGPLRNERAQHDLYAFVEVTDNGSGMDEETQARMFEPFFTTKFTGRGLGLAATLGIVHGHDGAIHVESQLSSGTCFRLLFPAAMEEEATATAKGDRSTKHERWAEGAAGKGTVLLVDDEEMVLNVGKRILELAGLEVITAATGPRALEIARAERDLLLVILDLTMPEMDGIETLHALRTIRADLPVMISSGHSEYSLTPRFQGEPVSGFIPKPYTVADLLSRVRKALQG